MKRALRSRFGTGALAAGLLCAGAAATPAFASWFDKDLPVPPWGMDAAKTPTPDYAKNAEAVVLYDETVETVDAGGHATERHREAIRILGPGGRNNPCSVTYDVDEKVNSFHVWTIAADGKTFPAQQTDFVEVGDTQDRILVATQKTRIARPPGMDPGAVMVCESEKQMAPYVKEAIWGLQDNIPFVQQDFELDLPPGVPHAPEWHGHAPVTPTEVEPNHWRWEVRDEAALDLRGIPSRPDWFAIADRMSVLWGELAQANDDARWKALGQWATQLEANRPDPSPEITAKTEEVLTGTTDFYSKLQRITEHIQRNVRYFVVERGIGGIQAHPAADIFRNGYGDCKDKTTLLISMLSVAGIHAFYVPVDDRRGVVDPRMPSFYGNHMITAIEVPHDVEDKRLEAVVKAVDGKRYLIFDPTNETTPVGNLPSYLQGSYGILSAGEQSQLIALPVLPPDANGTTSTGAFKIADDGTISGSIAISHTGPEGAELRLMLKQTDAKERHDVFETYVATQLPGASVDSLDIVQPTTFDKPIELHFKVSAANYVKHAGPLLLVRPWVMDSMAQEFDDKPRKLPIELDATGDWHDSFDIALPAGYVVDESPDPVSIDLDFASYHSSVTAKDNQLHYERELVVRQVELPAERAADFRKLEGQIVADQHGMAVLKQQ